MPKTLFKTTATAIMLAALVCMTASAAALKAKVSKATGDVQARASASASWSAVKTGDSLSEGSQVKTGAGSEAILGWGSGHVIKVGPLSQVTLSNLSKDGEAEKSKVSLDSGKVFAKAGKLSKSSSFDVKTPTAVAGVRGTGFECTPNSFSVVDGTITVTIGGQEITLDVGQMLENLDEEKANYAPQAIPAHLMQELREELKEAQEYSDQILEESAGESAEGEGADEEDAADEDVEDAIDSALDTQILNELVDEATSGEFEPGNGGLEGTIDITYGYGSM